MAKRKNNEVAVIGIGKFSTNLIDNLSNTKMHVIAIDNNETVINNIAADVDVAIMGDATSMKFLKDNGIHKISKIVLGMGSDVQSSLLTATNLIELGATNIYAKATSDIHQKILRQIGIKNVIKPEAVAARKMSTQLVNPIFDEEFRDFEVEVYDDSLSIARVNLINKGFFNKQIKDIGLPAEKASIILINRKGKNILPFGSLVIKDGDRINILGEHKYVYEWSSKLGIDHSLTSFED